MFIWQIAQELRKVSDSFPNEFSQVVVESYYLFFLLFLNTCDFLVSLTGFIKVYREYKVYKLLKCSFESWENNNF